MASAPRRTQQARTSCESGMSPATHPQRCGSARHGSPAGSCRRPRDRYQTTSRATGGAWSIPVPLEREGAADAKCTKEQYGTSWVTVCTPPDAGNLGPGGARVFPRALLQRAWWPRARRRRGDGAGRDALGSGAAGGVGGAARRRLMASEKRPLTRWALALIFVVALGVVASFVALIRFQLSACLGGKTLSYFHLRRERCKYGRSPCCSVAVVPHELRVAG
jgi:hypothetical protein